MYHSSFIMFVFFICVLLLWPALSLAQTGHGFFVSAPDVIRVGVTEKVLISVHNTGGNAIPVRLLLQSHPNKDVTYAEQLVNVEPDHPQIVSLQVDPKDVESTTKGVKQYAFLVVKSESETFAFQRQKEILLSYKSGYVFIQTDKPIYTPDHNVKIRVISLDQQMIPSNLPIKLEIRNPQDIIVKQVEGAKSETGFITETFHFPAHPVFGNWSVVAFYGYKQQHNTSVQFLVKEYVLPTFSVEVKPANKKFLLPEDDQILFQVVSRTTFGETVHGVYHVKYSILRPNGELHPLYTDSGKLESDGRADPELKINTLPSEWSARYLGSRLHVHVSVTEESSGKTEGTNNTQVMFVDTPYRFKWDNTMRYFKKGLPFEVKVDVKYANGKSADRIPINAIAKADTDTRGEVTLLSGRRIISNTAGQITFTVDAPMDATKLKIELETQDNGISDIYNARTSFNVNPQLSQSSGSYLVAQILDDDIHAGERVPIEIKKTGNGGNTTLYMFVVSKGQIVEHKTIPSVGNTIGVDLHVTFDMVPHARLVAYFIDAQNQVVADSVKFDVTHECNSDVFLTTDDRSDTKHNPKDEIQLHIDGDPGTQVGLLAIDSSIYLLQDNDKLTDEKMFKTMDDYDLGCGPGGGIDVESIFMESGVTVITNADLDTELRQDETCGQSSARRRRDVANSLADQYDPDSQLQTYCNIGASEHWGNSTACSLGAEGIAAEEGLTVDDERIQAFYNCCMLVNSETDLLEEDVEEEHVRSDFPETWIFDQVKLDNTGSAVYPLVTPDSTTTWIIQAVGVSSTQGMCVAKSVEVKVQPDFFIQAHLPPTVVRREQVEIVATVWNSLDATLEANVSILGIDGLCSETIPGDWSSIRQFDIPPGDSVLVKFNIVPLGIGKFPIEIKVVTPLGSDTIRKMLEVVPEGILRSHMIQIPLDPTGSNQQATNFISQGGSGNSPLLHEQIPMVSDTHQKDHINISLPAGTVPDSASVSVHISGNLMGQVIPTVIEGQRLASDVETPENNNGELVAAKTATNVYVMKYLTETKQLTNNVNHTLHGNIQTGVNAQYNYRKADQGLADSGSFAYHPRASGSTWLTAFVNKVFCQAKEFHHDIDPAVTFTAMDWLISNTQQADGSFHEVFRVHENDIRGGLEDESLGSHDAAKTAYVLISLLECNSTAVQQHAAIQRATSYLENVYTDLTRPFDMAIVTYALVLVESNFAYDANQRLRGIAIFDNETNIRHWEEDQLSPTYATRPEHWQAVSIETTGYALLAQLKLEEINYSHAIVNWLSQTGRFSFTQDTIIALQALSEYAIWNSGQMVNFNTTITNDLDDSFHHTVHVHPDNVLLQHTVQGPIEGQLIVDTKGTGTGQLAVQIKYHTVDDSHHSCPFNIEVIAGEGDIPDDLNTTHRSRRSDQGGRRYRRQTTNRGSFVGYVHVCTRYLGNAQSSNMAVIDVGLYSGFRPLRDTLEQIKNQPGSPVQYYEITNRSVIFYVDQIPSSEDLCLTFETIRDYVVGKIQPVAVRVYDYHSPERDCVKFYHPSAGLAILQASVCEGKTCVCAAASCPAPACDAKYCNTSYDDLMEAICQRNSSDPRTQSTFAYEVSVNSRNYNAGFDIVHMEILSAFIIGNDTALERSLQEDPDQTVVRQFWQSKNCQQRTGRLGSRRNYLVIGTGGLRYRDENGHESFKYILDDTYIIEDWPTGTRAEKARHTAQVEKLETLRITMTEGSGCST